MVHRPPDSRLLTNLINHEKEYTKHLFALFPLSHTALTSLSAYSIASPSSPLPSGQSQAQTIASTVNVFASAEDALHRYAQAVDRWREELASLKELEDDVGTVLRDREILVTRLIKASSKPQKNLREPSNRNSLNVLSLAASVSMSSLPTVSTTSGSTNTKLSQAQMELQACETHLAAKEQELEARRISVIRDGLGGRCKALIDCGWVWGEMGKEGLRVLNMMRKTDGNDISNGHAYTQRSTSLPFPVPQPAPNSFENKPLPSHTVPTITTHPCHVSDISSLTPSQSISQQQHDAGPEHHYNIAHEDTRADRQEPRDHSENEAINEGNVRLIIPPAHAISELAMPTGISSQPPAEHTMPIAEECLEIDGNTSQEGTSKHRRRRSTHTMRPLSRRISEVDEEEEIPVEPASTGPSIPSFRIQRDDSSEEVHGPIEVIENQPFPDVNGTANTGENKTRHAWGRSPDKRERRISSIGIFGSIRGFFKHKDRAEAVEADENFGKRRKKARRGWVTRTDANVKASRDGDSSDSDNGQQSKPGRVSMAAMGGAKLKKSRSPTKTGWESDGARPSSPRGTVQRRKHGSTRARGAGQAVTDIEADSDGLGYSDVERPSTRTANGVPQSQTSSHLKLPTTPKTGESGLSHASSVSKRSVVSAPPTSSPASSKSRPRRSSTLAVTNPSERTLDPTTPRRSASSGSPTSRANKTVSDTGVSPAPKSKQKQRPVSVDHRPAPSGNAKDTSLMSIVEDVTRQNREGWSVGYSAPSSSVLKNDNRPHNSSPVKLEVPKAPSSGVPASKSWNGVGSPRAASFDIPRAPGSVIQPSRSSIDNPVLQHPRPVPVMPTAQLLTPGTGSATPGSPRPMKSPLRSALKNSSRTPSPIPDQVLRNRSPLEESTNGEQSRGRIREIPIANGAPPGPSQASTSGMKSTNGIKDDSASISSYETGRESLDETAPSLHPAPAPDHEATTSVASTSAETQLPRRKSVRVSLQPQFSSTPPALYDGVDDDDDEGGQYASWTSRNGKDREMSERTSGEPDVWEDSSEEDEEYRRARRLLTRAGRKGKGKGKASSS